MIVMRTRDSQYPVIASNLMPLRIVANCHVRTPGTQLNTHTESYVHGIVQCKYTPAVRMCMPPNLLSFELIQHLLELVGICSRDFAFLLTVLEEDKGGLPANI